MLGYFQQNFLLYRKDNKYLLCLLWVVLCSVHSLAITPDDLSEDAIARSAKSQEKKIDVKNKKKSKLNLKSKSQSKTKSKANEKNISKQKKSSTASTYNDEDLVLDSESNESTTSESQGESLEALLIRNNIEISNWFDSQAEGIDLFLAGKKLTNQKNETAFRIENASYIKERETFNNITSFNILLRLPNLEKYWQLQLTSYDEVQDKRSAKSSYLKQSPREKNYGATIGWFQSLGNVRTAFQPRVELQDPLKVSHSITFESVAEVTSFRFNPKLEFYANPTKGVGVFNSYNFGFPLTNKLSLTWINEGEYEEKSHILNVTHGLSLGHIITGKKSLSYNIFYDFNNRPDYHMNGYNLSISWHETLYRRILSYQVTPYLEFLTVNGFAGVPGLTFQIFLMF